MAFQFRKTENKEKQETFDRRSFTLNNELVSGSGDVHEQKACPVPTVLSQGSFLEGSFAFEDPVCVEGTLLGNITSGSTLLVSETALVEADTKVDKLVVYGSLEGDVEANELVEIFPGASLKGDIKTSRLIIHDGASFSGRVDRQ